MKEDKGISIDVSDEIGAVLDNSVITCMEEALSDKREKSGKEITKAVYTFRVKDGSIVTEADYITEE